MIAPSERTDRKILLCIIVRYYFQMFRHLSALALTGLISFGTLAPAQVKRTSIPLGNAVSEAQSRSQITSDGATPFHIRINISEPENPQSPYRGSIEEWWLSKDQWRREVTASNGLHQTVVVVNGGKTEIDEGDYFPLWLHNFVTAAFDPIPNASAFNGSNATIDQSTLPSGDRSSPNVRLQSKVGTGDRATDAFSNISFDNQGRVSFFGSPRYSMEFHNYQKFGKKQIARQFVDDPEPGTKLVGEVITLEEESKAGSSSGTLTSQLFAPLGRNDTRFLSVPVASSQLEVFTSAQPPVIWPSVHSGNTSGHLAVYISVDSSGQVREAWPLNSDNAGLEDPTRGQILKWKLKPANDQNGNPIQIDGALGFLFDTKVENPIPIISGSEIAKQLEGCTYNPTIPAGVLPSGTVVKLRFSISDKGKVTGESFSDNNGFKAMQASGINSKSCRFKPYIVNGQPSYYFIDFIFTEP